MFGVPVMSLSVPKYRSPNSPMPGRTRKCSSKDISISDVTIFNIGNFLHTVCIPCGAYITFEFTKFIYYLIFEKRVKFGHGLTAIRLRKMMLASGTPLLRSSDIALTADFPVNKDFAVLGTSVLN